MRKASFFWCGGFLVFCIFLSLGCSSGGKNPITGQDLSADNSSISPAQENGSDNHRLIGTWSLNVDQETSSVAVESVRNLARHYYAFPAIPPPRVYVQDYNPSTHITTLLVYIKNASSVDVYDVRIIIFTDDAGHLLLNDDGWTSLYDPPGGMKANPFAAFKSYTDRLFHKNYEQSIELKIYLPPGNHPVSFALDASYPGHCEEPYTFSNIIQYPVYYESGSRSSLYVDVLDWQNDVSEVELVCPAITGATVSDFSHVRNNQWRLELTNTNGVPPGDYTGYLSAKSSNSGSLALYDLITISVSGQPQITDTQPPNWENTVGVQSAIPMDGGVNVYYGKAIDILSPPVEYLLYMDDDNNPWDQDPLVVPDVSSYVFSGLTNGQSYWFGVRCKDSALPANVDSNTLVLECVPSNNVPDHPEIISQLRYPLYAASNFAVQGDLVYVDQSSIAFSVVDASIPSVPQVLSTIPIHSNSISSAQGKSVAISGNTAVLIGKMGTSAFLSVIDVSDPMHPVLSGHIDLGYSLISVSIDGDLVTVAGRDSSYISYFVKLVDVSDPGNPIKISSVSTSLEIYNISLINRTLYATMENGFYAYDVTDYHNPVMLGHFDFHRRVHNFCTYNQMAFVATDNHDADKLHILDISNLSNIQELSYIALKNIKNIQVSGNFTFISETNDTDSQLEILDITNPASPVQKSELLLPTSSNDFVIVDNKLYFQCSTSGSPVFYIVDVSDPVNPTIMDPIFPRRESQHIAVSNGYAYLVGEVTRDFWVVDIHDPYTPIQVCELFLPDINFYRDIKISGNYAYVVSDTYLWVYDITDPSNPVLFGSLQSISSDERFQKIYFRGNYAFLACNRAGVLIVDISDPSNPQRFSSYTSIECIEIAFKGDYAFLLSSSIKVLDISDPGNPQYITSFGGYPEYPKWFSLNGNYLYFVSGNSSYVLKVADVTDPAHPLVFPYSSGNIGSSHDMTTDGNFLYISGTGYIFDIRNPVNPNLVTTFGNYSYEIEVAGNLAFYANGSTGMSIAQLW